MLVIIPLLPRLMPQIWRQRQELPPTATPITITKPGFVAFAIIDLFVMIALFLVGESPPTRMVPPEVAIIGATLALLVV